MIDYHYAKPTNHSCEGSTLTLKTNTDVKWSTQQRFLQLFQNILFSSDAASSQTICINFGALKMIVHVQTSVVYLISCTYLQIVGTNQSRRGNNVNLSATCHLTLSAPIATLVMPYKNPHCTSSWCCNFGTLQEHELKSHSVILTWSCIKLHVTQAINFHNFLKKSHSHWTAFTDFESCALGMRTSL